MAVVPGHLVKGYPSSSCQHLQYVSFLPVQSSRKPLVVGCGSATPQQPPLAAPASLAGKPSPLLPHARPRPQVSLGAALPGSSAPPVAVAVRRLPYAPSPGPMPLGVGVGLISANAGCVGASPAAGASYVPPAFSPSVPVLGRQLPKRIAARPVPVEVTVQPAALPLGPADAQPWIDAARSFEMNSDFDVSRALRGRKLDLPGLMAVMKQESVGKVTIQALADKSVLHHMVDYLGIPQMPALLDIDRQASTKQIRRRVEALVNDNLLGEDSEDVVLKPTHLSNGKGVVIISRMGQAEVDMTVDYLTSHIEQHLQEKAGDHESEALRSLVPGFLAQPKYQSCIGFKTPMELRVIALWGKVRLALWWWGRGGAPDEFPNRNAWLVRRPADAGQLSNEDSWELIHEHSGTNCGFDRAIELFRKHISAIAQTAEALAVAVGAPFLRADFFVGSARWGVRLNEVAYGCGVDYRNRVPGDWEGRIVDDAPAIAHILQAGMAACTTRYPPEHFLAPLGIEGKSYEDMTLEPMSPSQSHVLADIPLGEDGDISCLECAVPEELCRTIPGSTGRFGGPRSRSFHVPRLGEAGPRPNDSLQPPRCASFNSALCRYPSRQPLGRSNVHSYSVVRIAPPAGALC
eukprot:TRINITY_DN37415_c0_g1_i1.p1 TRINITY_DN37415_c0_g1~~TRINITY_DN37415_c0_g1_i1.p1  ORF type:complete len:658 (-),score=132.19 TRINITY_DN37415_c0_g1_i1:120-2015(-)